MSIPAWNRSRRRFIATVPQIKKTDQGSQFTSAELICVSTQSGINISMDDKGYWRDNIFVERFYKTTKNQGACQYADDSVSDAWTKISCYAGLTAALTARAPLPCASSRCTVPRRRKPAERYLRSKYCPNCWETPLCGVAIFPSMRARAIITSYVS